MRASSLPAASAALPALAADIPEPTEDFYVYDGAGVLSYETEGHIVFCNDVLDEACGAQIVFVTVDTVGSEPSTTTALELFNDGRSATRASRTACSCCWPSTTTITTP